MPNIWNELRSTERLVRDAEEFTQDFRPERRSSIRERALSKMALVAERPDFLTQGATELADPLLSPELRVYKTQSLALRQGAASRIRQQIEQVRRQDFAADADERAFAKASPLQQARMRDGWYRVSELDRFAAVAGLLRRERRQASPLTREATSRAKSIDAARGKRDPYVVTDADLKEAVDNRDLLDPCIEWKLIQKRRRETMFAGNAIKFGGYPGARGRSRSPC